VLVLHYRDKFGPLPDWVFKGLVGGQYGVTFFFVLSGFILTYRYGDWFEGGVTESRYWLFQRFRFARIYPVYVLGLLLDTPWHLAERSQAGQLGAVGPTYWASWLINLFGLQAWVPSVPFSMFWNTPAWSVAAEFFFYATFPFVCAWLGRWRPSRTGPGRRVPRGDRDRRRDVRRPALRADLRAPGGVDTQYTLQVYTPADALQRVLLRLPGRPPVRRLPLRRRAPRRPAAAQRHRPQPRDHAVPADGRVAHLDTRLHPARASGCGWSTCRSSTRCSSCRSRC
jgi:hypothetical protein